MRRQKLLKRFNGFTLLELLIVIVVIGILASMILVAASEMESTAKAAQIINNLKQLKTAATSWYWDNYGKLQWSGGADHAKEPGDGYTIGRIKGESLHKLIQKDDTEIKKYLGNSNFSLNQGNATYTAETSNGLFAALDGYSVYVGNGNKKLYVLYRISNDSTHKDKARLRAKLRGRSKSTGLITYLNGKHSAYNGENVVGMLVMVFE